MFVGNLVAKFSLDSREFKSGMENISSQISSTTKKVAAMAPRMAGLAVKITAVGAASAYAAIKFSKMLAQVGSIERKLKASVGGVEQADKAWVFLRKESARLGLSLEVLADNYGSLAAAAQGTSMKTEDLKKIFSAISEKAAILGMTSDRLKGTFLAIEQMTSKTVVSMEELRRQFGEKVPGALGIMARGLGVSVKQLNEWVVTGELLSEDVLPLLADQMMRENLPALEDLGDTSQRALSAMETAFFDLKQTLKDSVINDALNTLIGIMGAGINVIDAFVKTIDFLWDSLKGFSTWWVSVFGTEISTGLDINTEKLAEFGNVVKETADSILLTEEELADKRAEIHDKMSKTTAKSVDSTRNDYLKGIGGILDEFSDFVSDVATGVDTDIGDMLTNMAKKAVDMATQILVIKPILEWLKNWMETMGPLGGLLGGAGGASGKLVTMADGGMINEPIVGLGTKTGTGYLMGESGPEAVVPAGKLSGGGGGGAISINISAVDSKSVTDLLRNNPQAITTPLVEALNSGDRGLTTSLRTAVN